MPGVTNADHYYELLAHRREPRTVPAGELIFSQGDPGESLFVVRSGSVDLTDGDRVIETVEAPGLFGEMALIEDRARLVCRRPPPASRSPARHFWVRDDTPYTNFAQLVMRVMAQRLRRQSHAT